uniref:Phospholipid/glycerol acyltransferase domain-containing protein n=1 Tax=Fagus sylvatica TaxID=28930 RepID=A0A2N9F881_FAGSY
MENSGTSSFMRSRRLESCFNASSSLSVKETVKSSAKEELGLKPRADLCVDNDGWGSVLISWMRIVTCFVTMMFTTFVWALIMLLLLPWPYERIRQGNIWGHVTGRLMMWILGNHIKIEGAEFSNKRAIYISNHASPLDIFLIMWLTPTGTVGIAKKEAARAVVKNNLSLIIFPEGLCSFGIAIRAPNSSDGPDRYPSSMEEGQLTYSTCTS